MERLFLILIVSLLLCTPALADTAPSVSDFARVMGLNFSGTSALYELPLPAEVYRWSRGQGLSDVAVFNGAGELVPFALVRPVPIHAQAKIQALPLFPLSRPALQQSENLAMQVRTDEHGAIINLSTAPGLAQNRPPCAYLVDSSQLKKEISGFDLSLAPTTANYLGTLQVEISDDLQHWRYHAAGAVANMSAGGTTLRQQRVEFPSVLAKYFRLTLGPELNAPRIEVTMARIDQPNSGQARSSIELIMIPVKGRNGEFTAKTDGHLPLDRIRLRFSDDNSLAGATILSRPDDSVDWCVRGSATFYRLRKDGKILESPPVEVQPTSDSQWLIRVQHQGAGLGKSTPHLEIGWLPHRLIFAARGDGPYRLAYGSGRQGFDNLRDESIAAELETWEKHGIKPAPATAGPSTESGGKQALRTEIPATTWKKILLWVSLLLGVLLLARMAWRLAGEMALADAQKKTTGEGNPVVEKEQKKEQV